MSALSLIQEQINEAKEHNQNIGELSDGYHTFNELYEHRITLYIALCKNLAGRENIPMAGPFDSYPVWRTKAHSDGSVWDGWFMLGINYHAGEQITYHLPMTKWRECYFADELIKAPEWDGHTAEDVLKRLKEIL
jgi:hypothetical protein